MKKVKTLLYCTKAKPYLVQGLAKPMHTLAANNPYNFNWKVVKKGFSNDRLNGKIVAECEIETEEIEDKVSYFDSWFNEGHHTKTLSNKELEIRSCLSYQDLIKYLGDGEPNEVIGYALHISNLKIFDKPLELKDTYTRECIWNKCSRCEYGKEGKIKCGTIDIPLSRAPQNMMWVWYKGERYVLISIQSKWLCKILNGEKTIEVRRKVLNCMKEVM